MPIIQEYLYKHTVDSFLKDDDVFGKMKEKAIKTNKHYLPSDINSWEENIRIMKVICQDILNYFKKCNTKKRQREFQSFGSTTILFEISTSSGRVDCCLLGKSRTGENCVFIELKQWSNDFIAVHKNDDGSISHMVITKYKDGETPLRYHPSYQVSNYRWLTYNKFKELGINVIGIAFCYNCTKDSQTYTVLYDPQYEDFRNDCKIFTKEDRYEIEKKIREACWDGKGNGIFKDLS